MQEPVAIEYLDNPCCAVALYIDGSVRFSGRDCAKGTHSAQLVDGVVKNVTTTAFAQRCAPDIIVDGLSISVLSGMIEQHADLATSQFVPGDQYRETWSCTHGM